MKPIIAIILGTALLGPMVAYAQDNPAGVTVVGYGQASAPAESATLRFVIGEATYGPPTAPDPDATPGAQEREAIAPVIASLTNAGVPDEGIEVIIGPYVRDSYGFGGPAIALLRVELNEPDSQGITELVDAASIGAAQERLLISQVGVIYSVEDCAALEREAREQAIADARQRADVQAGLLNVTIGDLLASRDLPSSLDTALTFYGPIQQASGCAPFDVSGAVVTPYNWPSFDPTADAEVIVYAQVELTFSMAGDTEATPVP